MIINKFGGASIKDLQALEQMVSICKTQIHQGVIVVSAMGKMTNLLEMLTINYVNGQPFETFLNEFVSFHQTFLNKLFEPNHLVFSHFQELIHTLETKLSKKPGLNFDFEYDQIVPFGELVSSRIVHAYQNLKGVQSQWVDIRNVLKTDATYREGNVDWVLTTGLVSKQFNNFSGQLYLTQGFIGSDRNGLMTTLGREGSDFTAAILANCLVWKDVPGIMCADPDWIPNADKIEKLSYTDAIELSYYGAKVIHPKTIKPLQNKSIPLQVRSFYDLENQGTLIAAFDNLVLAPVYIKKEKQVLVSIRPNDLSFIMEENLSHIFGILAKHQIRVNLMQNSAISFSITVDTNMDRVPNAIEELKKHYEVKYNEPLELITIRHHKPDAERLVTVNREVLLEQRSRSVARFVLR